MLRATICASFSGFLRLGFVFASEAIFASKYIIPRNRPKSETYRVRIVQDVRLAVWYGMLHIG